MTIQFSSGLPSFPRDSVVAFLRDVEQRLSPEAVEKEIDPKTLKALRNGHSSFTEDELWPLMRLAYQVGLLARIPVNGLPAASYQLSSDVDIEVPPVGSDSLGASVLPKVQPTTIAGFDVDFPLGLPASIITANASFLQFYSDRGFCILTYKTVRPRAKTAHPFPQWVFLEHADTRLSPSQLDDAIGKNTKDYASFLPVFSGRQRYFPEDRSEGSMANSFGVPSHDPKWWMEDIERTRSFVRPGHQVLIVSVMSSANEAAAVIDDYVRTAEMACEAGANIIELNFSCPNTLNEKAGDIDKSPKDAKDIVMAVKKALRPRNAPVFAKIGYLPESKLREFMIATKGLLDGIVGINTVSAKINDPNGNQIFPGRPAAGLSGWVIKDVAQRAAENMVKIRNELGLEKDLTLLGLGGVMNEVDFDERLSTGVNAVEICSGAYIDPLVGLKIRKANSEMGVDFVGVVVRRDADGYGIVEFDKWPDPDSGFGIFTKEVLASASVDRSIKTGRRVIGRAVPHGEIHKILNLRVA